MLLLAAGALVLALLVHLSSKTLKRDGITLRRPPDTLPLVGNGIRFLQERQKLFAWFSRCERMFGYETLQISVPSLPPGVIISSPSNLEFVFKHESIFAKGEFFKSRSWDLFGNGIINVDGDLWRLQRKAGLTFLSAANVKSLTADVLPAYIAESVDYLKARTDGTVVDLQFVFHEITTQLMGNMAYNATNSTQMEMHADDDFGVAFDYASGATAERFQNPLWPVTEVLLGSRFRQTLVLVKQFGGRIVAKATRDRKVPVQSAAPNGEHTGLNPGPVRKPLIEGSLIHSLLDALGDQTLVADAALNYLSAGRDTTAQALTWTFYLLMRHPGVLREAIREAEKWSEGLDSTSVPGVAQVPYIHAVFSEALRLYPPIPFEIKQAVKATVLPDGTSLPKNSVVVWCPWAMNRSTLTWGPDADEFRPERWIVEGKVVNRSASEFPVFNGGARTCLGKKLAEQLAIQVIVAMVLAFDFKPATAGERESKSSLTLPMKGGLPVRVSLRQDPRSP
ncbi:cytochrome P450 [Plectosphaerella plurivora]|uniref:Cytochrome P450 n=1 Tax=Plectosphaerella plurivora TaxID=936078 RepID=A0A9P8V840_9PEZI|nr:cytochrome P450 [Plectosphaerella plurivora]